VSIVIPPFSVTEAIESGQCSITRRIEIWEADGTTPWYPSADEEMILRLVDGSISVDSSRPERRTLDLSLLNDDKLLRPNPNTGFWYDKVITLYRGINYIVPLSAPKITVVEQKELYGSQKMQLALRSLGYSRTFIDLGAASWDAADSDVIVSYTEDQPSAKVDLLTGQYYAGRAVLTFSTGNTDAEVPLLDAGSASGAVTWGATPVNTDTPLSGAWTAGAAGGTATGWAVSGAASGVQVFAVWQNGTDPSMITGTLATNESGGRWIDLHLPNPDSVAVKQLLAAAISWLADYSSDGEWETQIGEFCIDTINDQRFPYQLKVTGRDYMKRMMLSKLSQDETFVAGTLVTDLIIAMARNSGITREINVPASDAVLTSDVAYTRSTPRSDIAIAAANGIGQQLYFNAFGILTMEPLPDPTLDATVQTFKTGSDGNLVSLERSTNDSNLFNHIAVYGSPNSDQIPFYGEAKNTDPSSPTRIARIGDRYYDYNLDTVTSDADCQQLAMTFLQVSALATYEFDWESIVYPHLEANVIAQVLDPDMQEFEPDKYLMDTFDIPLKLGAMSATGKRITKVGDPGDG
jgi:hypothetical protein